MGGMLPRGCLLGKRCLPNTPLHHVYKWVSHVAMELMDHLCLSFVSFTLILQYVINTKSLPPRAIWSENAITRNDDGEAQLRARRSSGLTSRRSLSGIGDCRPGARCELRSRRRQQHAEAQRLHYNHTAYQVIYGQEEHA